MKKLFLMVLVINILLFWGCKSEISNINIEKADSVIIFYGFNSHSMVSNDKSTVDNLKEQFSNLTLESTEEEINQAAMLRIIFRYNGKGFASFNVDDRGILEFNGEPNNFKISSGSFDYDLVRNIYFQNNHK